MRPEEFSKQLRAGRLRHVSRVIGLGLAAGLALAAFAYGRSEARPAHQLKGWVIAPPIPAPKKPAVRRTALKLTAELRDKGYNECYTPDPVGLGPYAPYRNVRAGGRLLVPQLGGLAEDGGYDVVLHFHGHEAVRKTFVQVTRGAVFVGFDKGQGSGAYTKAFREPTLFDGLLRSIEHALKDHSGDPRAHIRHLALSAWSAGYGAVNEILRYHASKVDAVVLADALHAGWAQGQPPNYKRGVQSVTGAAIAPILKFAVRARQGGVIFALTHSRVDPVTYPSTALTADFLLKELGVERFGPKSVTDPFGLLSYTHEANLHVWSYAGRDELAHCSQTAHVGSIVRDILETAWDTPEMDRSVASTKAPKLGPHT